MHQVPGGDKPRRYTDSLITRTVVSKVLSGNRAEENRRRIAYADWAGTGAALIAGIGMFYFRNR